MKNNESSKAEPKITCTPEFIFHDGIQVKDEPQGCFVKKYCSHSVPKNVQEAFGKSFFTFTGYEEII